MTTSDKIAVMQAWEDGIIVQYAYKDGDWLELNGFSEPVWDWEHFRYRIKPEPKLRPYKSAEEFLQAQKEHGMYLKFREYYHLPLEVSDNGVVIKYVEYKYNSLLQDYRFQDGTPCGIIED